jgi:hypothetical protein
MKTNITNLNAFFLIFFGFSMQVINSQTKSEQKLSTIEYVKCFTVENEAALNAKYPNRQTKEEFENWFAPNVQKLKRERTAAKNQKKVYNIPVVIHIVHNGDALGTGENITDAQAKSQITVLNQDFRRLAGTPGGTNTSGVAVDVEINFCLVKMDPNGNATSGIIRHNISPYNNKVTDPAGGPDWETREDVEKMKTVTQWDPNRYLNTWIIRPGGRSVNLGGLLGILGYAQFPTRSNLEGLAIAGLSEAANTDGLLVAFDAFGTIAQNDGTFILNPKYNVGRTMTHEVGHFLGLRHIWGDNNSCEVDATDSKKDYCLDTPAATVPNRECKFVDTCPTDPGRDQIQNHMDYTDDTCVDTFTQNQKDRMLAVMEISPRRKTLNLSPVCDDPKPYIKFNKQTGSLNEDTNCSYTDYNIPINILKSPSTNTEVTITEDTTSSQDLAIKGLDYELLNTKLIFPAGSKEDQNFTIRIYNDGISEKDEIINLKFSLITNGGDALIDPIDNSLALTIVDNDKIHVLTTKENFFKEDFDGPATLPITYTDRDKDTFNWEPFLSNEASIKVGLSGNFIGSRSWIKGTDTSPTLQLRPDNLLTFTNPIILPANDLELSFTVAGFNVTYFKEKYAVYLTTSNNPEIIVSQTPIFTETPTVGGIVKVRNIDISKFAGQTVYLTFRHFETFNQNSLALDDIKINKFSFNDVQTSVNTTSVFKASLNTTGKVYAKDAISSKPMADITSNTNFDYGCTTVFVSRDQTTAGAAAVNLGSNVDNKLKVLAKTVTISPTTNDATGASNLKFYFSEAEIAEWETATGNTRNNLSIIQKGVYKTATIGAFGPNVTLSADFNTGIDGIYYFGASSSLATSSFDLENSIKLYPVPVSNVLNIDISGEYSNLSYVIYNAVGQVISNVKVNSKEDLKVNTTSFNRGVYFIKLQKEGGVKTLQFIKN